MGQMERGWDIQLLGGLKAARGDCILAHWRSERAASLLAYLAFHLEREHPRESLAGMLWYEHEPIEGKSMWNANRARLYLNRELCELRRQLEPLPLCRGDVIVADRHTVRLNPADARTDVGQFRAALRSAEEADDPQAKRRSLLSAVQLYEERGPLLPELYDDWVIEAQEELERDYRHAKDQAEALTQPLSPEEERDEVARRHAEYCLQLVNEARIHLYTRDQVAWFERLDAEHQNCLAAIEWQIRQEEVPLFLNQQSVRIVWMLRGHARHVRDWLREALVRPGRVSLTARPYVHQAVGTFSIRLHDFAAARRHLGKALTMLRERGDMHFVAGPLIQMAEEARWAEDYSRQSGYLEEALALYRTLERLDMVADIQRAGRLRAPLSGRHGWGASAVRRGAADGAGARRPPPALHYAAEYGRGVDPKERS